MGDGQQSNTQIPVPALKVVAGEPAGRVYVLRGREILIGRSDACEVVLNQEPVSRIHAKITLGSVIVMVKDLDSTNGTFVDDIKIEQMALADGSRVKIGATVFQFIAKYEAQTDDASSTQGALPTPSDGSQDAATKG